jgi:hypothetical protein
MMKENLKKICSIFWLAFGSYTVRISTWKLNAFTDLSGFLWFPAGKFRENTLHWAIAASFQILINLLFGIVQSLDIVYNLTASLSKLQNEYCDDKKVKLFLCLTN